MKKLLTLLVGTLLLTITACTEKTTEKVEVIHDTTAVFVPEKQGSIHKYALPAPVINHGSNVTTTTKSDESGSLTTQTYSETVH